MSRKKANTCFRCGGSHSPVGCRFKDVSCNYCGKKGHIAKVCYSRERDNKQKQSHRQQPHTHQLTDSKEDTAGTTEYSMHHASADTPRTSKPIHITLQVNQADLTMEVDTGAAFSVISEDTYNTLWSHTTPPELKRTTGPLLKTESQFLSKGGFKRKSHTRDNLKHSISWLLKDTAPASWAEIGYVLSHWIGQIYFTFNSRPHNTIARSSSVTPTFLRMTWDALRVPQQSFR